MQQAIYNSNGIAIQTTKTNTAKTNTAKTTARRASLIQRIAHRWDMIGVVALMTSSAAYGIFAIAHVI